jgi:hypothetical protein
MRWENVRAPAGKPIARSVEAEDAPRRYLSPKLAIGIGAGLVLAVVLLIVATRKPAAPELLRPAGPAATTAPAPNAKEYRSENVILRFPEQQGDAAADARR